MPILLLVISLCPLAASVSIFVCGQTRFARCCPYAAAFGSTLSFVAAVVLLVIVSNPAWVPQNATQLVVYRWIQIGGRSALDASFALRVDTLSAIWLVMLTFVTAGVAIKMCGSAATRQQASGVCLLLFVTVLLLLSSNLLMLFIFWQLLAVAGMLLSRRSTIVDGACGEYLSEKQGDSTTNRQWRLSGFPFDRSSVAPASRTMFLFNRSTDVCFIVGLFFVWNYFGTFEFSEILTESTIVEVAAIDPSIVGAISVCLIAAALGKCAQFPIFVWLEGSTAVPAAANALLHSATMLPSGVYLVARCMPLFAAAPQAQLLMAIVGGLTVVLTGVMIAVQDDLRRILAYSSAGQFGMILLALSTGTFSGVIAGLFLLNGHAIAKAMLFMAVGDVSDLCDKNDSAGCLGLRRVLPAPTWMFLGGAIVLASGLWGQSSVLAVVWRSADRSTAESQYDDHQPAGRTFLNAEPGQESDGATNAGPAALSLTTADPGYVYSVLSWSIGCGVFLTALALSRACFVVFHGNNGDVRNKPASMVTDNGVWIIFCLAAVFVGVAFGARFQWMQNMLARTFTSLHTAGKPENQIVDWVALVVTLTLSVSASFLAWLMHSNSTAWTRQLVARMESLRRLGQNRFYLDHFYAVCVLRVLHALAGACGFIERFIIEGLLVGSLCRMPIWMGNLLQPLQNGIVQFYALSMILTIAVLLALLIWLGM